MEPTTESMRFQCPHCSKQLRAPINLAGESVRCPKCRKQVDVPLTLDEEQDEEHTAPSRKRWMWVAGSGLILAGVVGIGLFLATRTRTEKEPETKEPQLSDLVGTWDGPPQQMASLTLVIKDDGKCVYIWQWPGYGPGGRSSLIEKSSADNPKNNGAHFVFRSGFNWEARTPAPDKNGWLIDFRSDFFRIRMTADKSALEVFPQNDPACVFRLQKQRLPPPKKDRPAEIIIP